MLFSKEDRNGDYNKDFEKALFEKGDYLLSDM